MKFESNYRKFVDEVKNNGFDLAFSKTNNFLSYKTRKLKPKNLYKSIKAALLEEHVLVTWSGNAETKNNFGDALNPILIDQITNKTPHNYKNLININSKPVYSVVGSILDNKDIKNLEVWGSGFMYEDGKFKTLPKKVHAVRGPLTRELVLNQGVDCPDIYGDPGLLISQIYNPKLKKKYKLGIIPHYVDKENEYVIYLKNKYPEKVLIIDIQDSFNNVINNVNKCEMIVSSSLHGIITADAYNIPSLWIKISNKINGGNFKYRDYMLSVGRKQMDPFVLNKKYKLVTLFNKFEEYNISINLDKLLEVCPFV